MKRYFLFLLLALFAAVSCSKDVKPESDFTSPVSFKTKGTKPVDIELIYYALVTKETDQYVGDNYFFLLASLVPGTQFSDIKSNKAVNLSMFIPGLTQMKKGQEIEPDYVNFSYYATSSLFRMTNKITSGKIVYKGISNKKAIFEFREVIFTTCETEYAETGEHVLNGIMECPVFDTVEDAFTGFKELGWI